MITDRQQRYLQAKPIALAALNLDAAQREMYLANACGDDDALREEVRWLIDAGETITDRQQSHAPASTAALPSETCVTTRGNGTYRLKQLLGDGGMGVVYLAERVLDEGTPSEIRQSVALKLLHVNPLPGDGWSRRFEEERRILATLNHPNIAHLIDTGTTGDGRPYLALEYVDGERIDRWCEQRQLSLRERVKLFMKVCAAVQYAHQHLVIHCDIKPNNILITKQGEPKLLDFGIARLIGANGGLAQTRTETAQRALTLAYASPEQVRGQPLSTTTDVWALGVVLYQLVSGQRPFRVANSDSSFDISNAIVTGKLVPPSQTQEKTRPAGLARVPKDIDAIVLKALRNDPTRRYQSVAELADDLERFLAFRPVLARLGQRWYEMGLFAWRNRLALGVSTLIVALTATFVISLVSQLHRVQVERDKTQAVASFLSQVFEKADPSQTSGNTITVREVLDQSVDRLRHDAVIAPDVKIELLQSIARSYRALYRSDQAVNVLLWVKALQDQAASTPLERGETLLAIADGYTSQTLPSKAIPAYEQAITLFEQAGQSASRDLLTARVSLWHAQVSASEASPSTTVAKLGRLEDQLHTLVPPEPKLEIKVLMTLAVAYREMGQYPAAVRAASQSLSIAENLHDPNVMLAERSRFYLAFALEPTDPARATQLYQQSIAVYTKVIGHGGTGLSELYGYEGASLAAQGRHAEAAEAFATALELTLAETTPRNDLQDNLRAVLAHEYLETGRCQDAANLLQPALAQFAKQAANHSAWSLDNQADALDILALCAIHAGQLDQAQRDIDQKLTPTNTLRDNLPVDDGVVTPDPSGLVQVARHHFDEARQTLAYLDAQNRHAHVAENSSYALNARLLEATLLLAQGQSAQAADITTRAVATSNHRRTPCDLIARNLQVVQAQALHALGKPVPTSVCHGYTILPPTHET